MLVVTLKEEGMFENEIVCCDSVGNPGAKTSSLVLHPVPRPFSFGNETVANDRFTLPPVLGRAGKKLQSPKNDSMRMVIVDEEICY